ncbi:unnamed protein product [Trichogramma brassicae]|uniref:Uncharacterized protein n=1 Tax=Trichogramma brassicae TaxID=86971 RepID=A0A6H5IBD4_9HYME|nr:unnamed protein product [Trichogramma brassicae]
MFSCSRSTTSSKSARFCASTCPRRTCRTSWTSIWIFSAPRTPSELCTKKPTCTRSSAKFIISSGRRPAIPRTAELGDTVRRGIGQLRSHIIRISKGHATESMRRYCGIIIHCMAVSALSSRHANRRITREKSL